MKNQKNKKQKQATITITIIKKDLKTEMIRIA